MPWERTNRRITQRVTHISLTVHDLFTERTQINELCGITSQSMELAGTCGERTLSLPSMESTNCNLLDNVLHLNQLGIRPILLLDALERAIGRYKTSARESWLRTFNPLFWLEELVRFIERLFRLLVGERGLDKFTSMVLIAMISAVSATILALLKMCSH